MSPLLFALHLPDSCGAVGIFQTVEAAADYVFNHTGHRDSDSGRLDGGVTLYAYKLHAEGSLQERAYVTDVLEAGCRKLARARHAQRDAEQARQKKFTHFVLMLDQAPGTPSGDVVGVFTTFHEAVDYVQCRCFFVDDARAVGYRLVGTVANVGADDPGCILGAECDFTEALLGRLSR